MIILDTTRPRAKREHVCSLCLRTIRAGEVYMRSRIIGDDPYVWKQCEHCSALIRLLNEIDRDWYDYDEGYSADAVIDYEADTPETLAAISAFQSRWTNADGSLFPVPEPTP